MIKIKPDRLVVYMAVVISLVFTPINIDALIIPKVALLFTLAMYILPELVTNIKIFFSDPKLVLLFIISFVIIFQMIIVMLLSDAPFEQEFFGRTGRGLGFSTFFSAVILILCMAIFSKINDSNFIIFWLSLSGLVSSLYALTQRFGFDIFNWESKTNGIIGTLGNPNFQSSFTAMTLVPILVYSFSQSIKYFVIPINLLIFISTLYFTQSTQGYVVLSAAALVFLLLFTWYGKRLFFSFIFSSGALIGVVAIAGMLNKGPLAYYLYKPSVQSRGDFWRSAFNTANANPVFGTGIDSFGDSFLIYRDRQAVELADNAHNYFLEFAATGGYPLAILNLIIVFLTFYSFISLQKKLGKFDAKLASIFCAWIVIQMQSLISPGTVTLIVWGAILSGFAIGSNIKYVVDQNHIKEKEHKPRFITKTASVSLLVVGLLIMFPLYKTDRDLKKGLALKNGDMIMKAATAYPESSVRYNVFTQEFLKSNLLPQALELGRKAVEFNPNAVSAWALVFINPQAPLEERVKARDEILRLDPLNTEVFKFKLE
jgi:putative inorganic carbon (HCO3(-)) transporter